MAKKYSLARSLNVFVRKQKLLINMRVSNLSEIIFTLYKQLFNKEVDKLVSQQVKRNDR